jgi:hypothetical protein
MKRTTIVLGGLVSMLLPSLALAQEMPPPPAELSAEKWFVGNWTCEGTQHAMPGAPETKYTDSVTFKMDMGGFWLHYSGEYTKPKKMPWLMGAATYDAGMKKHVRFDSMQGGGWAMVTSAGWEGDKLVFDGDSSMMGKKMKFRHTITKKGEAAFDGVIEVGGPDGKLMPMIEESCKKKK